MNRLSRQLVEAGLLQFGVFASGGKEKPYHAPLDMLASYPSLLDRMVEYAVPLVGDVEYLLASADAIPIGVGMALRLERPLVYSRGSEREPASDLVGAYDIGHSAALITGVLDDNVIAIERLMSSARRLGLDVRRLITVIDAGTGGPMDTEVFSLLHLPAVITELGEAGVLPEGQGRAVQRWIDEFRDSRRDA